MNTYFCSYIGAFVLSVILTPVVIVLGRRLRIYDIPTARKVHTNRIPRVGGVAIFVSSTLLVVTVLFLDNAIGQQFRDMHGQIIALLVAGMFIFAVGLVDDIFSIRARYKLLAQVAAAGLMCAAGVRIQSMNVANLFILDFGIFRYPLTIFWIISITNAVNLIDGLDGLAAGICTITSGVIAVLALMKGDVILAVIALALAGSLSGFLFFNFNPARIFMGDCGSMFMGFLLGSISVMFGMKSGTMVAFALPFLVLGVPIFDTLFSMLRRYLNRWGVMSPDRGHLHHRLLDMGLRHHHVVLVMYGMTAAAAGLGMFMMVTRGSGTIVVFFAVLLLLLLAFRALGAVRLRESIARLKRKKNILREAVEDTQVFQEFYLAFGRTKSFRQWWHLLCDSADRQGLQQLRLEITGSSGREHCFYWRSQAVEADSEDMITVSVPVNRLGGLRMHIEAKIPANGLLESTGRRMMLFGRLIDEYTGTAGPMEKKKTSTIEFVNAP